MRALRDHPLLRKLLEADPELLLPYLLGRLGETQRHALELIARDVTEGQADGSIRAGDARLLAFSVLLMTQSFLFSAGTAEEVEQDEVLDELANAARGRPAALIYRSTPRVRRTSPTTASGWRVSRRQV